MPITLILLARANAVDQMFTNFTFADSVNALCYGILGLVLIKSEPRNRLVWFFVVVGFCLGVTAMISGAAELIAQDQRVNVPDQRRQPEGPSRQVDLLVRHTLVLGDQLGRAADHRGDTKAEPDNHE
ncbi:MAG: hypothetical protein AAGK32_16985, partial [Actinomycetota bacterium]